MAMIALFLSIDEQSVVSGLERAAENLDGEQREVALDFSAVHRIDARGLQAIDEFARRADEKNIKVILRGVDVDVYKTLKLARLARQFSFVH
jgi:anti-anti-sigma regulatory factor